MKKEEMPPESEPKNPFAGILGDDKEGDEDDDDGEYEVSPEEVSAAAEVQRAMKGSPEELARAICTLVDLHQSGGG